MMTESCVSSIACFVAHSSVPTDKYVITQTVQWVIKISSSTKSILLEFHTHLDGNTKGSIVHFCYHFVHIHWPLSGHVRLTSPCQRIAALFGDSCNQHYYDLEELSEVTEIPFAFDVVVAGLFMTVCLGGMGQTCSTDIASCPG